LCADKKKNYCLLIVVNNNNTILDLISLISKNENKKQLPQAPIRSSQRPSTKD
jgi:hypothetical protein